jgi:cell division protein ZapE
MQLLKKYQEFCQKNNYKEYSEQIHVVKTLENFLRQLIDYRTQHNNKNLLLRIIHKLFKKNLQIFPQGIYIYGGVGRGKSMLMDLFFNYIHLKQKKRVHFHKFMQETHASLRYARKHNKKDALLWVADKIAKEYQLICFDEFQVLDITDAMLLGRLFTALIERNIYFVMTSNRPPQDLYLNGLNRQLFLPFINLLNEKFQVVSLNHETDFRLEKIKHQNHYLSPLNELTKQQFTMIWNLLTDNSKGIITELDNAGRKIRISQTHKNVAYSTFNNLCDIPLGASDYLLIADNFTILLLDEIPQLTPEMRNQATRFRNLIDACYEKRVKLYFRSAATIDNLYLKGDYSFEFERTISRIQEMQAIEY